MEEAPKTIVRAQETESEDEPEDEQGSDEEDSDDDSDEDIDLENYYNKDEIDRMLADFSNK